MNMSTSINHQIQMLQQRRARLSKFIAPGAIQTELVPKEKLPKSHEREDDLLEKLTEFYSHSANLDEMLPVVLKKSKISLRVLDFFVTTYSRDFQVCYKIVNRLGRTRFFNVHDSYKAELKGGYHKTLFDPFRRGRAISFEYMEGCTVRTTAGQLNFFRWAIGNKVLEYVEKNLKKIKAYMHLKGVAEKDDDESSQISTISSSANVNVDAEGESSPQGTRIRLNFT